MDWIIVTDSKNQKYNVKGTVLSYFLCGKHSRFKVEMVRTLDKNRDLDVLFRVRDAEAISDAEIREGKVSPVVATFATQEEAMSFVERNEHVW